MEKKIVALVVTYNRKDLLQECLQALLNQTYPNMDICVIDNASTDGTEDVISNMKTGKKILYYNTGENLGGAGGFNYGLKLLVKMEYDYIWIMDDDTIPESDALSELMVAEKKIDCEAGFLASNVIWSDGTFSNMNHPGIWKKAFEGYEYRYLREGILRLEYSSFVSIMIPVQVVKTVGLPIKEFFIWKDDYEYTTRISKKYKCYFVAKSKVLHKIKNNDMPNLAIDNADRIGRYIYEYRNGYYLTRINGIKSKIRYYCECMNMFKEIVRKSKDNKYKRLSILLKGIFSGWFFKPEIEYIDE